MKTSRIRHGKAWNEQYDYTLAGLLMTSYEQKILKNYITQNNGSAILDVGGGVGIHAKYLNDMGYKVFVVDTDSSALEVSKKLGLRTYNISGLDLESINDSFQYIICFDVHF